MVVATKEMLANPKTSIIDKRFRYQILAAAAAHILTVSHGIGLGWLSPTLESLQSPTSPLSFTIDVVEASWIGSLFGLGCLTGNVVFGIMLDKLGRKWTMYFLALPHMVFWVLVYISPTVEFLYIARYCAGLTSGGLYIAIPIFISEISHANIRGALTSTAMLNLSFGILIGFILSTQLNYHLMPCIVITLPLIYLLASFNLPETPQFLLKQGKIEAAEQSYKFYNNALKEDAEKASPEMQRVEQDFGELKTSMLEGCRSTDVTLGDFFNKPTLKIFLTAFVLMILNQFSSSFAFVNYMTSIFAQSGSTLDPKMCTIIMGVVQILGTLFAATVVDRFGRRILLLSSALGMAAGMIAFGIFTQVSSAEHLARFNWIPLALMISVMMAASFGVIALIFTIIVEILPTKIRSKATSICMCCMSCMVFVSLKIYLYFLYNLGLAITMYSCAGVCIVCSIYLYAFLPETKGKSLDDD